MIFFKSQHRLNVLDISGDIIALLGQFQQFQSAFSLEPDQFGFLHFLEDLDHVRIGAVNLLGQNRGIDIGIGILQLNQHHGRLLPKEDVKNRFFINQFKFHPVIYSITTPIGMVGLNSYI